MIAQAKRKAGEEEKAAAKAAEREKVLAKQDWKKEAEARPTRGILGKTFLGVFGAAAGFKLSCPYPGMGNSIVRRPSAGWPALGDFKTAFP